MGKELFFETVEEMEAWECENDYPNVENNGASGRHIGYTWFTAILENGSETELYLA